MVGRTASLLTHASPPPSPDTGASAPTSSSAEPARAALLQAPRTSLKRDGVAAGLPGRAPMGRQDLNHIKKPLALKPAAAAAPDTAPSRFADALPSMTLKF